MIAGLGFRSVAVPIATGVQKDYEAQEAKKMTTLEGRHPLIAVRTRARERASLLEVVLIALVTLAAAVAIAFAIRDNGGAGASQPAVAAKHAPVTHVRTVSLPPDVRYDGGPEEGTRGPQPVSSPSSATRFEHGLPKASLGGR
jgi:hypothetical protein